MRDTSDADDKLGSNVTYSIYGDALHLAGSGAISISISSCLRPRSILLLIFFVVLLVFIKCSTYCFIFSIHYTFRKMVAIPDSLAWELTKKNTAFLKKKNGHTKRSGAIQFSVEKGNVKSLNKFKYSGIANSKAVDVTFTDDNRAKLVTRTASKISKSPKKGYAVIPLNKDFRRVEHTIKTQITDNYYRPDLKQEALGKWTQVYKANRRAKGVKPVVPTKKGRGKH